MPSFRRASARSRLFTPPRRQRRASPRPIRRARTEHRGTSPATQFDGLFPLFSVPARASSREDDGWLVGAFLDYVRGLTGIAVFDARGVDDGPVARAWLEYPLPLAFHGEFSPA